MPQHLILLTNVHIGRRLVNLSCSDNYNLNKSVVLRLINTGNRTNRYYEKLVQAELKEDDARLNHLRANPFDSAR